MRISFDDELRGRSVIDGTGRVIGMVESVLIDNQSWRVEAFKVRLRREAAEVIGAQYRVFHAAALEIPVDLVHAAGDAVILNVPTTALRELRPAAEATVTA